MNAQGKLKVTTRIDYDRPRPSSPTKLTRSATLSGPGGLKPKAKVNSGAHIVTRKLQRDPSPARSTISNGVLPRAPSPLKQPHPGLAHTSSSSTIIKAKVTSRPPNLQLLSPPSDNRTRTLTTIPSDPALSTRARARRGSVSSSVSHVISSPRSEIHPRTPSRPMSMVGESGGPVMSGVGRGVVRVKSKVTRVVADSPPQPSSASSSPPPPSTRNGHGRTPSIPTISIASPLFPISGDTSPAASHYRSPATPDSPTRGTSVYQPFPHHDDLPGHNGGKADPALIPLPLQSPPMSTISFSSRSSVSYDTQSSGVTRSTAPTVNSRVNGHARVRDLDRISVPRAGFDSGPGLRSEPASRGPSSASEESLSDSDSAATNDSSDDDDDGEDAEDPDRKIKDEAKSNRKIADLEITNKSLLAINSSLEAAKHRQAKEIRDLKRKLRETRLTLPPPAFHAVKHDDTVDDDVEGAEDEDEDDEDVLEGKDDEAFQRVRGMIEGLLDACQRALETKPSDFIEHGRGGAKVLTAEEVRSWRGDVPESEADTRSLADADDDNDAEPSPAAGPSNHIEASPLRRNEGVPPITVTSS